MALKYGNWVQIKNANDENSHFNIIVLVFPLFINAQTGMPIFAMHNGIITANSQFVDPIDDVQRANGLSYTGIDPVNVSVGSKTYTIKRAMFTDWLNF